MNRERKVDIKTANESLTLNKRKRVKQSLTLNEKWTVKKLWRLNNS